MQCKLLQVGFDESLDIKSNISNDIFNIDKDQSAPRKTGYYYFPLKMDVDKAKNKLMLQMIDGYVSDIILLERKVMKLQTELRK